jgi:hypothetical protein
MENVTIQSEDFDDLRAKFNKAVKLFPTSAEIQAKASFFIQGSLLGPNPIYLVSQICVRNDVSWKLILKEGWLFPLYRFELIGNETDVLRSIEQLKQFEC